MLTPLQNLNLIFETIKKCFFGIITPLQNLNPIFETMKKCFFGVILLDC